MESVFVKLFVFFIGFMWQNGTAIKLTDWTKYSQANSIFIKQDIPQVFSTCFKSLLVFFFR